MTTNLPDALDEFVRPVGGNALNDSDGAGKLSTHIVDDLQDAVEEIERAVVGPTMLSVASFTEVNAIVLNTAEAVSDGSGAWTTVGTVPVGSLSTTTDPVPGAALSASLKTTGSNSITARLDNGQGHTTNRLSVDLPGDVDITSSYVVAVDIAVDNLGSNTANGWQQYSVVVGESTGLGGTQASTLLDPTRITAEQTFYTVQVDVSALSQVRSIGVLKTVAFGGAQYNCRFWIDNVRFMPSTGIDQAMLPAGTVAVVVPASYTSVATQQPIDPETKTLVDLRQSRYRGGDRHIDEWQLDDIGGTDVSQRLLAIMNDMPYGSRLLFNPTGEYRIENRINIDGARRVIFDAQGATFFSTIVRNTPPFSTLNCTDVTLRGFNIFGVNQGVTLGSAMTTVAGTPTTSGTTKRLTTQNDSVRWPNAASSTEPSRWSRDKDGYMNVSFTLSDSNQVASDCKISLVSAEDATVLATTTLTLTSTPTIYTISYYLRSLSERISPTVTKLTASANTITLTTSTSNQYIGYDVNYENGSGFIFANNNSNCIVEDMRIECVSGDGIGCAAEDNVGNIIRRVFIRGTGRQGITLNQSDHWLIEDFVVREGRRHGVDIEPYIAGWEINNMTFRNGKIWNQRLGPFVCINSPQRVKNLIVDNVEMGDDSTSVGDFSVGAFGGHISNIRQYFPTGNPTGAADAAGGVVPGCVIGGQNMLIENMLIERMVNVIGGTHTDDNAGLWTHGGHTIRDIRINRPSSFNHFMIATDALPCIVQNVSTINALQVVSPGAGGTTWAGVGPIQFPSTQDFNGIDVGPVRALYPNTYKGLAQSAPWVPGGFDHLDEPVVRVRGLSGASTRGNNFRALNVAVTASTSTKTITFATRSYPNPAWTTGAVPPGGGTLTPSTNYYYRMAGRPLYGGPPVPLVSHVNNTSSTGTVLSLGISGLGNAANGVQIAGVTLYRGLVSAGPFTMRYDWIPDKPFYGVRGSQSLWDFGTYIQTVTANNTCWGYPTTTNGVAGTYTPVDETGYEPDVNYGVFLETSWATTWSVTAKRTDGFDLAFGTAAPGGGGLISWMIVR